MRAIEPEDNDVSDRTGWAIVSYVIPDRDVADEIMVRMSVSHFPYLWDGDKRLYCNEARGEQVEEWARAFGLDIGSAARVLP